MDRCGWEQGLRVLLVLWLTAGLVPAQGRHPLPVLWLMPVSSGSGGENLTAGVAPAVRLALQDLRKQPPPLGNYEIQLQLLDSQVHVTHGGHVLFVEPQGGCCSAFGDQMRGRSSSSGSSATRKLRPAVCSSVTNETNEASCFTQ